MIWAVLPEAVKKMYPHEQVKKVRVYKSRHGDSYNLHMVNGLTYVVRYIDGRWKLYGDRITPVPKPRIRNTR